MENPAILLRRLNPYCARAMEGAASLCQTRAHAEILPEHWLLKLLEQGEGDLTVLARRYEWDMDALWQDMLAWLDNQPRSVRQRPQLSARIQTLLQEAWLLASLVGEEQIRSVHLLMALVAQPKLMRCDSLWPLLTLGQSQLERLRPLLDTQSDERPEMQLDEELAKSDAVEFVGRPVGVSEIKEGELSPALQNALDKFTLDVTAKAKEGKIDPVYHYGDNFLTPGSAYDRNPAPESGAFFARIRHERYLNGQTQTRAITSCPTLFPGQVLKVTGGYEVADVFAHGVAITTMHTHARRDEDFGVNFEGIPDSPDFGFRPEPGKRPVMAGTLPARVTSTTENDTYGHIDKDGRYRVNMLFDRDNWETGFESLWVRQSRPYAGDTYGLHLPLLAGTEVAIGFEDGNPLSPDVLCIIEPQRVIAGQYNQYHFNPMSAAYQHVDAENIMEQLDITCIEYAENKVSLAP